MRIDRLLRPSLETSQHPAFPHSQYFTTFSDPALTAAGTPNEGTHYTFASSSCVKPGFPWTGPSNKLYTKGASDFLKVAERVGVRFMLFLGDTIYADVPWYSGAAVKNYYKHWRQFFASPQVKKMVEKIPFIGVYDDHEIYNVSPRGPPFSRAPDCMRLRLIILAGLLVERDFGRFRSCEPGVEDLSR